MAFIKKDFQNIFSSVEDLKVPTAVLPIGKYYKISTE